MAITKIALSITYDDGRPVALEVDPVVMSYMASGARYMLQERVASSASLNLSHDTHLRAIDLAHLLQG